MLGVCFSRFWERFTLRGAVFGCAKLRPKTPAISYTTVKTETMLAAAGERYIQRQVSPKLIDRLMTSLSGVGIARVWSLSSVLKNKRGHVPVTETPWDEELPNSSSVIDFGSSILALS